MNSGKGPQLKGPRFVAFFGAIVGFIGLALYPIVIEPMMNPGPWQELSRQNRKGIEQENIQPGNMKVWTDPFDREGKPGHK